MQLTLSAQVERTCNFKILSLRLSVCVFSFWKVSILSKRKTHIAKRHMCWFIGKLEMGESTYMKNFNQPIKTANSISSGRQAATSSHGCLRQPEETYFGKLLLSQWAFSVKSKMSQLPWAETVFCFHFSLVWENRNAATIWAILVILVSCIPIYGATCKIHSILCIVFSGCERSCKLTSLDLRGIELSYENETMPHHWALNKGLSFFQLLANPPWISSAFDGFYTPIHFCVGLYWREVKLWAISFYFLLRATTV